MTTEQPTELEDIDGFFLRGELDESAAVLADRPVGLMLDEEVDTVPPASAAQLARRARLRKLVVAIVTPLGLLSAVLLAPRALGLRAGNGSEPKMASAAILVDRMAPVRSLPVAAERAIDQAKQAGSPTLAVEKVPASAAAPKVTRVAMRAAARVTPPALTRSSRPSDPARSTDVPATPSQGTGSRDSLPTARFPSSAPN